MSELKRRIEKLECVKSIEEGTRILVIVMRAGQDLDPDACVEILQNSGRLSRDPIQLVYLADVPGGLNAAETENYLRNHPVQPSSGGALPVGHQKQFD